METAYNTTDANADGQLDVLENEVPAHYTLAQKQCWQPSSHLLSDFALL